MSYELPRSSTLDRTLLVNPFRDFGFYDIRLVPGDLDADMIDSTDVHLHYEHPGRWSRDKVVTVRPGGPEEHWKLRLSDPELHTFRYRFSHRLKDGTTVEGTQVITDVPLVMVNDPYDEPLVVELFPNYNVTSIKMLLVDVRYTERGATRERVQQLRFGPIDTESRRVRFARTDPASTVYSVQLTILGLDNSVRRLSPIRLENTVVFLGELMGPESLRRNH